MLHEFELQYGDFHGRRVISRHKVLKRALEAWYRENKRHSTECCCGGIMLIRVSDKCVWSEGHATFMADCRKPLED